MEALWQKALQSVNIYIKINKFIFAGLAAHAPIKDYHVQRAVAEICIKINIYFFAELAAHAPITDYHVQSAVAEGIAGSRPFSPEMENVTREFHVQSAVAEGITVSMSKSEWKRCGRRDCSQSKYASK